MRKRGVGGRRRVGIDAVMLNAPLPQGAVDVVRRFMPGESHAGAGLGIRYDTGIGPIRLDLATPISGDSDGSSLYIYVGIGQAF